MGVGVAMQADIRREDVFILQILVTGRNLSLVNRLYGRSKVVIGPNFRRNEQEFHAGVGIAELIKQFSVRFLEFSFICIRRIPLKIVNSFENHDDLRMELGNELGFAISGFDHHGGLLAERGELSRHGQL